MVRRPRADHSDVDQADTDLQPVAQETGRQRALLWTTIAIYGTLLLTFVLVPPFTPPTSAWQWSTEQAPWQVVDRVPWSPYPKWTLLFSVQDPACTPRDEIIVFAFGQVWRAPLGGAHVRHPSPYPQFGQLDRNRGLGLFPVSPEKQVFSQYSARGKFGFQCNVGLGS
jgi:hypothetical protein